MPDNRITFRMDDQLNAAVRGRTPPGDGIHEIARRDLTRYYEVLRQSREHLRATFDRGELCLILDANNGTHWEPWSLAMCWANVADAIGLSEASADRIAAALPDAPRDTLLTRWGVTDGDDLVRRLRALSPGHACALVDAIEQFWTRASEDTDVVLRDLGLIA